MHSYTTFPNTFINYTKTIQNGNGIGNPMTALKLISKTKLKH